MTCYWKSAYFGSRSSRYDCLECDHAQISRCDQRIPMLVLAVQSFPAKVTQNIFHHLLTALLLVLLLQALAACANGDVDLGWHVKSE